MTKKTVLKKNSNTTLKNSKDTKLSIQFNLDGFSFCITNINTKKTLYFSEYLFEEKKENPESLLKEIEQIFETDSYLQNDFSSILVIYENYLSALVPNKYFSEDKLSEYLNLNIKTLTTDYIAFDNLKCINAKNIYVPYVNINNYLFQNFGEFVYKHHQTLFIEKLISLKKSTEKTVYINVSKRNFDFVVIKDHQLKFSNSFSYNTKEDFIYYILFNYEQLKLDVQKVSIYFTGDIELDSEIYKITYKYIRNVYFLESKNALFNHLNSSKHSNFILLGS